MPSTYSSRLKLELMATGANAATWGINTNNNLNVLDSFVSGYLSKDVGGSSNVVLTTANASASAESSNKVIEFTGELLDNIYVFIPETESNYLFYNNTSGSYSLTIAPTNHDANNVTLSQGSKTFVYCTSTAAKDLFGDDVTVSGNVSASYFIGDGSSLTNIEPFVAGTKMLFQQTSAPTGWTKDTTHDNKALRVVTGSVSSGGANSFTNAFNSNQTVSGTTGSSAVNISGSVGSTTLTESQIPAHNHRILDTTITDSSLSTENYSSHRAVSIILASASYRDVAQSTGTKLIEDTGGGSSHNHTAGGLEGDAHTHTFSDNFNLNVQYVDLIIASKD